MSLVHDVGFSLDAEARPEPIVAMPNATESPAVHAWHLNAMAGQLPPNGTVMVGRPSTPVARLETAAKTTRARHIVSRARDKGDAVLVLRKAPGALGDTPSG